jgi:hypothetical protein
MVGGGGGGGGWCFYKLLQIIYEVEQIQFTSNENEILFSTKESGSTLLTNPPLN